MDLEDLFKTRHHRKHEHYPDHHSHKHGHYDYCDDHRFNRHEDHPTQEYYHGDYKTQMIHSLVKSITHNKALLAGISIAGIILFIAGIFIIWAMIPLAKEGINYIQANGIKGLSDVLLSYADKIWKGNG